MGNVPGAAGLNGSEKASCFNSGMSAYQSGRYSDAVSHFERAVTLAKQEEGSLKSHNGITCLAWLGLALFMLGEHDRAAEVFDKCNTLEEQGFGLTQDYAQTLVIIGHALASGTNVPLLLPLFLPPLSSPFLLLFRFVSFGR